jgi:uncharacterized protein YndB with AHSA1/START domain
MSTPTGTTIVNSRTLNASPAQVYAAFRDPEYLHRWWGPNGFTNTFQHFDFRPGGEWKYTMHGPDGVDYENESEFVELVPGRKVVILHLRKMHRFTLTIDLTERDGKTELQWHQAFDKPVSAELEKFLQAANEQNLDRLAACVANMPSSAK